MSRLAKLKAALILNGHLDGIPGFAQRLNVARQNVYLELKYPGKSARISQAIEQEIEKSKDKRL